jgi:SET domain-containing protein
MRRLFTKKIAFTVAALAVAFGFLWNMERRRLVVPAERYEILTEAKPSQIPGAGLGLFAKQRIVKGDIVGEMGGRLITDAEYVHDNGYFVNLPPCARAHTAPFVYLDGLQHGGHTIRINFAPREINGVETHFQNAKGEEHCEAPYFVFRATRDIDSGEEIWMSYGGDYNYDFMEFEPVKNYFCARLKTDCATEYRWRP